MPRGRVAIPIGSDEDFRRFWDRVEMGEGCWNWTGAINSDGYGSINRARGQHFAAHQYAWMLMGLKVPEGHELRHKCKQNRRCVRPSHLETGTHEQNIRDMVRDGTGLHRTTPEQIEEMVRLRGEGLSFAKIASRFGVATNNVVELLGARGNLK